MATSQSARRNFDSYCKKVFFSATKGLIDLPIIPFFFLSYITLGISSFRLDGKDYIVSGCEDRSFKI